MVMVFNATFTNISVISWMAVLLVEETGVPGENHRPDKGYHLMLYRVHLTWLLLSKRFVCDLIGCNTVRLPNRNA